MGPIMSRCVVLCLGLVLPLLVLPSRADETVKGFACTFTEGTAASYDKGAFRPEPASAIRFEVTEIGLAAQTATLVIGERRATVRVFRGVSALNVLEIVAEGYLNVTTIYDRDVGAATHPAVHARHFGVLSQPVVSHYRGSCVVQ
jgi:hypothetical protein